MPQYKRPLTILHLASSERWTGVAEPVTSLAMQQQAMGHRVWLACVPGQSFERKARRRGVEVLRQFHLNRRLNPLHFISDFFGLRRFCRKNRIDIVHAHLLHDHWTAALALKSLFGLGTKSSPILIRTLHTSALPRSDRFHRKLWLQYTDQIVCVSEGASRQAESILHLPQGSVPSVRGGVDLERFRPDLDPMVLRSELNIPADAPVAGIVARMRAGRGLRWLMQAVPAVLERVPNARLIVVGRGELKRWFKEELKKEIYHGQVIYAGYRTKDLPLAYAAMDVSLFLGLGSEGTCRAILEAMGCARPTIGVNKGAVPETIVDKETGILVQEHDVAGLSDKMSLILGDRKRCADMGKAARQRAETLYTESARSEAFEEIYQRLIDKKRP